MKSDMLMTFRLGIESLYQEDTGMKCCRCSQKLTPVLFPLFCNWMIFKSKNGGATLSVTFSSARENTVSLTQTCIIPAIWGFPLKGDHPDNWSGVYLGRSICWGDWAVIPENGWNIWAAIFPEKPGFFPDVSRCGKEIRLFLFGKKPDFFSERNGFLPNQKLYMPI